MLANGGPSKLSEAETRLLKQIKLLEETIAIYERLPRSRDVSRSVTQMHDAHSKLVERLQRSGGTRRH